jgi:DNA modification methylase
MDGKLQVEYRPVEQVEPYARNARTHSNSQIRKIARAIKRFGFTNPILVDENGVVVAGHARLLAALELGLKLVPTICISHLSEAEKRAYILADNRLAEDAGWDQNLLHIELDFLASLEVDFDLDLTGFSVCEVDQFLHLDGFAAEDNIPPEVPEPIHVVTQPGNVWILEGNRVICGDCRDAAVMDRLMAGYKAQMVLTDPPYNVPIAGHVSGLGQHQHPEFMMASGDLSPAEFTEFLAGAFGQFARVSDDGSLHYIFFDWRHVSEFKDAGLSVYDDLLNTCVWAKTNGGMGSLYRSQHELVFVFKHGKAPHRNNVELGKHGRYRTNVWNYAGVNSFGRGRDEALAMHPTVKPVELLADAILDVTARGDIVLDGFLGSGSTLIAAERTGRRCFGVELDPAYVDVVVERWERDTGLTAVREADGHTLQEIRRQRNAGEVAP